MFSLPHHSLLLVSIVSTVVITPLMCGLVQDARAQTGACTDSRARFTSR